MTRLGRSVALVYFVVLSWAAVTATMRHAWGWSLWCWVAAFAGATAILWAFSRLDGDT